MARLQGRTLFFITSPRTPMKMLPEIEILVNNFTNRTWNTQSQEDFMKCLTTGISPTIFNKHTIIMVKMPT